MYKLYFVKCLLKMNEIEKHAVLLRNVFLEMSLCLMFHLTNAYYKNISILLHVAFSGLGLSS